MDVRISQVPCPPNSSISDWLPDADLADAFAAELSPASESKGIDAIARSVFGHPSPWFRMLLSIRDAAVRPWGVKSSKQLRRQAIADETDHIDFFQVMARSETEIVLGENDRHLDFRASLLLRPKPDGVRAELVVTTVVRCHNAIGRIYLAAIAPFHRHVIRSKLSDAAARDWN